MKYDLFISYSRKDFDEVSAIIERIKAALPDISYWFDISGVESGDDFEDKIISAIDNSSYLLFALSENSIKSEWAKKEVKYAKIIGKKVIPILLKGAEIKGWFLFHFNTVDYIDSTNTLEMGRFLEELSGWTGKQRIDFPDAQFGLPSKVRHEIPESTEVPGLEAGAQVRVKTSGVVGVIRKVYVSSDGKEKCMVDFGEGGIMKRRVTSLEVIVKEDDENEADEMVQERRIWQVGDYYNVDGKEGVVFRVDETGEHGKILSLDQVKLSWCTSDEYNNGNYIEADNFDDGMVNQRLIMDIEDWQAKYPAFAWCALHGEDWYLPAVGELEQMLFDNDITAKVNATLKSMRKTRLFLLGDKEYYWSSTEHNEWRSRFINLFAGCPNEFYKYTQYFVRAVAAF